jgi:hypothetical protein
MSRWYQRQWWYVERPFPWWLSVGIVCLVIAACLTIGAALA